MQDTFAASTLTKLFVSLCLIFILFLSFFDTFVVDGIVPLIQEHYDLSDNRAAIIRTASSIVNSIAFGLVWVFGDVFRRRRLYLISLVAYIALSLLSMVFGSQSFTIFVVLRSLASGGSSVFAVLTPVILADLFKDRALGYALMCFPVCRTVSSLLSSIVSSWIVSSGIRWQYSLIVGPLLSIPPFLVITCVRETIRNVEQPNHHKGVRRMFSNAFGLFSIKSYLLMTATLSFGVLHVKAYSFWFPSLYLNAWSDVPEVFLGLSYTTITALNSVVMLLGTGIGLPTVLWLAQSWHHGTGLFSGNKGYARAYPVVLSVGAVLNVGTFIASILFMDKNYVAYLVVTFLIGLGSAAGSSLGQQMMLAVVPSSSRASAVALSRLISGIVSTPSAQIVGMISDAIRGASTVPCDKFHAYQTGLLCSASFLVAVAICFILLIFVFPGDCERAKEAEKIVEETAPLIDNCKNRSESLLDIVIRSRTTSVSDYF